MLNMKQQSHCIHIFCGDVNMNMIEKKHKNKQISRYFFNSRLATKINEQLNPTKETAKSQI